MHEDVRFSGFTSNQVKLLNLPAFYQHAFWACVVLTGGALWLVDLWIYPVRSSLGGPAYVSSATHVFLLTGRVGRTLRLEQGPFPQFSFNQTPYFLVGSNWLPIRSAVVSKNLLNCCKDLPVLPFTSQSTDPSPVLADQIYRSVSICILCCSLSLLGTFHALPFISVFIFTFILLFSRLVLKLRHSERKKKVVKPGDLVSLSDDLLLPFDVLLVSGRALTMHGTVKEPARTDKASHCLTDHSYTLLKGEKVRKATDDCTGLVLSYLEADFPSIPVYFDVLILLAIAQSLDLPLVLAPVCLALAHSLLDLRASRILRSKDITCSLQLLDTVPQLKTLNADDEVNNSLEFLGVLPATADSMSELTKEMSTLDPCLVDCMVSCHSLLSVNGVLYGSSKDLQVFNSTGWTLDCDTEEIDPVLKGLVSDPSMPSFDDIFDDNGEVTEMIAMGRELGILDSFSKEGLQAVVVKNLMLDQTSLYVKGRLQEVLKHCLEDNILENLMDKLPCDYTVQACAYRELTVDYMDIRSESYIEGLTFLGCFVFSREQNWLKEVKNACKNEKHAKELRAGQLRTDFSIEDLSFKWQVDQEGVEWIGQGHMHLTEKPPWGRSLRVQEVEEIFLEGKLRKALFTLLWIHTGVLVAEYCALGTCFSCLSLPFTVFLSLKTGLLNRLGWLSSYFRAVILEGLFLYLNYSRGVKGKSALQ